MRPLIGITTREGVRSARGHERPIDYLNASYSQAVEAAGGMPILIPILQDVSGLQTLLPCLDGIVLPGGLDIDPRLYHQQPHHLSDNPNHLLDTLELALAHWALQEKVPALGICRGMQLLNVALGGELYQDLGEQHPGSLPHSSWDQPRGQLIHTVQVQTGSRMEKILGQCSIGVNSLHHQAIRKPGNGVIISGYSEDGVAELMEVANHPFMLGVQCHPEELYQSEPAWARLLHAFIAACTQKGATQVDQLTMKEYAA